MSREYVVVWNGVNDGHDGDLLNPTARQVEKSLGKARSFRPGVRDIVAAALPSSRLTAASFRDLIERTGCSAAAVNNALYHLRLVGVLQSEPILPASRYFSSRAPQRYWRTA